MIIALALISAVLVAATFNAVLLFVVAGCLLYEGAPRLFSPEPVGSPIGVSR